ncbi:hypothetical protein SCLCIDRAFT_863858 [Scleroderma citrinum Foug A]|uniref:Uncharacterized protein n=1 Tax=Scleroderma citrinum Foug A TaxID=1036808 RepID=A0A0C3E0R5_9AGAM|nr:hypothetical protein SCLCIDRAFT_863858 [Scleroderma citrinum Foug A]
MRCPLCTGVQIFLGIHLPQHTGGVEERGPCDSGSESSKREPLGRLEYNQLTLMTTLQNCKCLRGCCLRIGDSTAETNTDSVIFPTFLEMAIIATSERGHTLVQAASHHLTDFNPGLDNRDHNEHHFLQSARTGEERTCGISCLYLGIRLIVTPYSRRILLSGRGCNVCTTFELIIKGG